MMNIKLFPHQLNAIEKLKTGSILCGGVGSGKSLTSIAYFFQKECDGDLEKAHLKRKKDLYIITTAAKRDKLEWEDEARHFMISKDPDSSIGGIKLSVDSWNNIKKYENVESAFFIFDEQRVPGYGAWVKSFLKITKRNNWILLSATPGDVWSDYIPVFIANGFYKNKTEFMRIHAVFNRFSKFPKIEKYIETGKLLKYRNQILVMMPHAKKAQRFEKIVISEYDKNLYEVVKRKRWNPYKNEPIREISAYCHLLRKVSNLHESRLEVVNKIYETHKKIIVFYNFDYELDFLKDYLFKKKILFKEYNGHKHEDIPEGTEWIYLVQYTSGAEGWNCVVSDTIVFFSQNYSYRVTVQAAGRIDRINTPYDSLYYYYIKSNSSIDKAISEALERKGIFNENAFGKEN